MSLGDGSPHDEAVDLGTATNPSGTTGAAIEKEAARDEVLEQLANELGLLDESDARKLLTLQDALSNLGKWVLFVGAGASKGAEVKDWDELTRFLGTLFDVKCPAVIAENAFPGILEACLAKAVPPETFWEAVADEVCKGDPTELHELLLQLPFEAFLTTNFDCLLERAHASVADVSPPRVISYPDQELQAVNIGGRRLVHLHGRCREGGSAQRLDDQSVVLTQSSYSRAYGLSTLPRVIEATISAYSLLFVGTSFTDWQLRMLLSEVRDRERRLAESSGSQLTRLIHGYALVGTDGEEPGSAVQWSWPGTVLGIEPIFYVKDKRHTALLNILRWLVRSSPASSPGRYEVVDV